MFVFIAHVILREIEKYLPDMHRSLMEIYKHIGAEEKNIINALLSQY